MNQKLKNLVAILAVIVFAIIAINPAANEAKAGLLEDILRSFRIGAPTEKTETKPTSIYAPTVDYEQAVISAVETGLKSVVSIVISKDVPVLERCALNPFGNLGPEFNQFFGDSFGGFGQFYGQCPTGRQEKQDVGGGSGFIVTQDGLIITNKHVVSDERAEYTVITTDGKKYPAKVLARNPVQDLAILKIDERGLTAAKLGDSNSIRLGQTSIAIGNALAQFSNTISVGVISGLARNITAVGANITENLAGLIQTDAAINPGNSGGPLLNLKGEVIGINVAVAEGAQSIGFAIPINQAKRDIESVRTTGVIKTPYIGVRYTMITKSLAESQELTSDYGALIRASNDGPAIIAGSPAEKAGLRAEDIVLEVNGVELQNGRTLGTEIQNFNVGDTITLKVKRGVSVIDVKVTLADRPQL